MFDKEERPILKMSLSKTDRLLELFSLLFFLLLWAICIVELVYLPDIIPIHFDFSGRPDNYGNKYSLIMLPIIISLVAILFTYLCKRPHIFNYPTKITNENAEKQYRTAAQMLRVLKLGILFFCNIILILVYFSITHQNINLGIWTLPLIFCSIILPTIIYVIKLSANK